MLLVNSNIRLLAVIKLFSCSTQLQLKFILPIIYVKMLNRSKIKQLSRQFILLINVKVTTFMPSKVEHEPFFDYGLKVHALLS